MKWIVVCAVLLGAAIMAGVAVKSRWEASNESMLRAAAEETLREERRVKTMRKQGAISEQEQRLQTQLAEAKRRADALDVELKRLHGVADAQRIERQRLLASGTLDDALALGKRLGYDVKACQ